MRMSKDGLCAIVTGSASGLGAATATILAKGGARIVVNYSNSKAEAEATADLCRSAGAEVVVVQGDVSRDEDCRKIAAAAAAWGRLDVLVNNAGTTKHVAHHDLDGLSAEDFQRIYAVNTIGLLGEPRVWLDETGRSMSDQMKVEERFHRVNSNLMEITVTIEDPKFFTGPWVAMDKFPMKLQSDDYDVIEMLCAPSDMESYSKDFGDPASGIVKK
jgi:NAD(P)-dependent dehydrogenase (short-subunit alcohol dehydrogenase family)